LEHTGFPLIGRWFDQPWMALLLSWGGALYDLTIPFWLLWHRTRPLAYLAVIGFHVMTALLFPIGMFPWIMIGCTLVFFDERDYRTLGGMLRHAQEAPRSSVTIPEPQVSRLIGVILACFFAVQLVLPLRHWFYPGDVTWNEEGFRFAWNVMLVEKTGHATFFVRDPASGRTWDVYPAAYLTTQQENRWPFNPTCCWSLPTI
ncbi:MAG: HTTM domain-containing protein, partial [Chloroflexaceae bacterium]|nr:HTTM domain-containing protein [Chloroflexaceae bacterium]